MWFRNTISVESFLSNYHQMETKLNRAFEWYVWMIWYVSWRKIWSFRLFMVRCVKSKELAFGPWRWSVVCCSRGRSSVGTAEWKAGTHRGNQIVLSPSVNQSHILFFFFVVGNFSCFCFAKHSVSSTTCDRFLVFRHGGLCSELEIGSRTPWAVLSRRRARGLSGVNRVGNLGHSVLGLGSEGEKRHRSEFFSHFFSVRENWDTE